MNRVLGSAASLLMLLALLGCCTTNGSLYEDTAEREKKDAGLKLEDSQQDFPAEGKIGLEIDSRPEGAHVYLNNRYMGITPVLLEDVEPGRHKLTIKKEGYYTASEWIDYYGGYEYYRIELKQITGFLMVEAVPARAEAYVGSARLPAGRLHELPVGPYTLRIRAFGYEDVVRRTEILERTVTTLSVVLQEAEFALSDLEAIRGAFNPRNAGLLGKARIRFRVSSYGSGRALILDAEGREVAGFDFPRFSTWDQELEWDGRSSSGAVLPDGLYTVRILATSEKDGRSYEQELGVAIDSSIVLLYRSLWSGSAGLLYAPSADVLPGGAMQVSSLFLAHAHTDGGGANVRVPVNLGLRLGIGEGRRFELDTTVGGIVGYEGAEDAFYLPLFASAALKASLLRPRAQLGLSSALQAKLAYQNVYKDTLANFSGLSLGAPTALHWGPAALLLSPELIVSPWTVSYDSDTPATGLYSWAYGRVGLVLDLEPFIFGTSLSLRTLPFHQGLGLDTPFQAAVEAHWLIPGTQLFLSFSLAGEFRPPADYYYLLGGGGLGILN